MLGGMIIVFFFAFNALKTFEELNCYPFKSNKKQRYVHIFFLLSLILELLD